MIKQIGRAESITVDSDEDGFYLTIVTDEGSFSVVVQEVSRQLLDEVNASIGRYWEEGQAARQHALERRHDAEQADAYDLRTDPKHPDWHSVHADRYDAMRGDR